MEEKKSIKLNPTNLSKAEIAAITVGVFFALAIIGLIIALAILLPNQKSNNSSSSSSLMSSSIAASSSIVASSAASSSISSSSSSPVLFYQQQGNSLQGQTAIGNGQQGTAVSMSGDGQTLVTGAPFDSGNVGTAWVFERDSQNEWVQTAKLVGTGNTGNQLQGSSVAISFDGNTIAVGSPSDGSTTSGVFIFVRSGSNWVQQGSELTGAFSIGNARQGTSVSLSYDGNRLVFGGPADNGNQGSVWVFSRTGTVWTENIKLNGIGSTGSFFGTSISLSLDGQTLATGGPGDSGNVGATWIYVNTSAGWVEPVPKLIGTGSIGNSRQGTSVSLSGDATTLLIGAPADNSSVGAVWYFQNVSGSWTQIQKISGSDVTSPVLGLFGSGVSVTLDGNACVIGAPGSSPKFGFGYVYSRISNSFVLQELLAPHDPSQVGAYMGYSTCTDFDASTIAFGSPLEPQGAPVGKTYVFFK